MTSAARATNPVPNAVGDYPGRRSTVRPPNQSLQLPGRPSRGRGRQLITMSGVWRAGVAGPQLSSTVRRQTMRAFSGRGSVYLAVASMLGWIVVLREVLLPLVASTPVSQAALIASRTPIDRRLVLLWYIGLIGGLLISAFLVMPWVRRDLRRRRGLCVVCGYDVSGLGIRGQVRCPECGATRVHCAA